MSMRSGSFSPGRGRGIGRTTNKPNERKRKRNEREHHAHPQPIIKLNEYPPYPHTSGRVGATANARQHRSSVGCFFCVIVA